MSGTTSHWLLPYDQLADTADIEAVGKALADRLETVFNARFGTDPASGGSVRTALGLAIGTDVQAHDADLDAIAALTTTSIGRSLLAAVDAAALRTILALGTAATHATGDFDTAGAAAAAAAASQPLDSDLTAIAALTTTSFGRSLLALADAAAARAAIRSGATAHGSSVQNAGPFAIGDSATQVVPVSRLDVTVPEGAGVLLVATVGYRNNTGGTATPSPTFGRHASHGAASAVAGWTRLGGMNGYNTVASGTSHAGNGPVLTIVGNYFDAPAAGDYTYSIWWDGSADNSDTGYMAGVAMDFSAVVVNGS